MINQMFSNLELSFVFAKKTMIMPSRSHSQFEHYFHSNLGVPVELVSKELNHFGVIADLFRQIGGHSSRFVLFCSF